MYATFNMIHTCNHMFALTHTECWRLREFERVNMEFSRQKQKVCKEQGGRN